MSKKTDANKAHVNKAQQHQGGGGNDFTSHRRHTNGKKKRDGLNNPPSVNKYANLIGRTKQKTNVEEGIFMSVCRCNGAGTCSVCVAERKGQSPTAGKLPGSFKPEKERKRGYRWW